MYFSQKELLTGKKLTARIMVSSAHATRRQQPGCYTLIEIPMIDLLYGDRESLIKRLV